MPYFPQMNLGIKSDEELVYIKTNIAGLFFDAVIETEHTSKLNITSHPVQTGANVSDHAYLEPATLTMKVKMSDCVISLVPEQFKGSYSKSVSAFKSLTDLQASRVPFSVLTRLKRYENMLIETIITPDDYKTLHGLEATITMRELIVSKVKTVKVSKRPHVTNKTSSGTRTAQKADETLLYSLLGSKNGIKAGKSGDGVVTTANKYLGGRYVWGGNNLATGVDCSSFVQLVLGQLGIKLPRTATEQSTSSAGTPVHLSKIKTGDLLFFEKTDTSSSKPITHVAIYRGDGTMVHAVNPKRGICVDSVDARYWKQRLVLARRFA